LQTITFSAVTTIEPKFAKAGGQELKEVGGLIEYEVCSSTGGV